MVQRPIVKKLAQWQASELAVTEEAPLTSRELDILRLIARGCNNAQIAEALGVAEQTTRNYISRLYEKVHVSSRAQAIVWARTEPGIGASRPVHCHAADQPAFLLVKYARNYAQKQNCRKVMVPPGNRCVFRTTGGASVKTVSIEVRRRKNAEIEAAVLDRVALQDARYPACSCGVHCSRVPDNMIVITQHDAL